MFPFNIPPLTIISKPIGAIYNGAKRFLSASYDIVTENAKKLLNHPWEVIKSVRDSIAKTLSGATEFEQPVKGGAEFDKTAAGVLKKTGEVIAAIPEAVRPDELNAVKEFSEKEIPHLERPPSEESIIIKEAKETEDFWGKAVAGETAESLTQEAENIQDGDKEFAEQTLSFINNYREESNTSGLSELTLLPSLSKDARRRSLFKSRSNIELAPYNYVRVPIPSKKTDESDGDYAKRITEAKEKRSAIRTGSFSMTLDLGSETYPVEGDPRNLLYERLLKEEKCKELLLLNTRQVGIGFYRNGSKVTLSILFSDESSDDSIEVPAIRSPENYSSSSWWMEHIPQEKREWKRPGAGADEYSLEELFQGDEHSNPPRPAFRSGYSLYHLSLFRDRVHDLKSEGLNVDISPTIGLFPDDVIGGGSSDSLHITVTANREEQKLRLIKGTDLVFAEDQAAKSTDEKPKGNYIRLEDHLNNIKKDLQPVKHSWPKSAQSGSNRQNRQNRGQAPAPEPEPEAEETGNIA